MSPRPDLAPLIDHTLLRAEATPAEVDRLCAEARHYGFATVCVAGRFVPQAVRALAGTPVGVSAVVGFPLGSAATRVKAFEAACAVDQGAREVDVVADLAAVRGADGIAVMEDLRAVVAAARGRAVKAILETALFEAEPACVDVAARAAVRAGVRFLKTSTGFGPGGATVEAVRRLRAVAGPGVGVKASGGIRTAGDADRMVAAGADRLGASAGVVIVGAGRPGGGQAPSSEESE